MGCPRTWAALEGRAPAALAGRWDGQDYLHSTSPATVFPSPWSLWESAGTSHTTTTQAKGCAPHHGPCEQLSIPSALILPGPAPQSQRRHPGWCDSFSTAGYPDPQAAQGCSRYFSSFFASSASEAGLFLGHEGVLQALQRMRKRMRMSNAMTQLKEIATTAPVERAAPIATVPQEKGGPAARPHAQDASAVIERAASTRQHWQGTKGMVAVLAMGWGWGQVGSGMASSRHSLAARSCFLGFTTLLGRIDQSFASASPPPAGHWGHGDLSPPSCT